MNTQNNMYHNPNVQNQNYYHDQLPETQMTPQMPANVQTPAQEQAPQGFILDANTRHIINTVHPELLSAFVNIAIKKFAQENDFQKFFIQDQYKDMDREQPQEDQPAVPTPQTPNASLNFGGGW